MLKKRISYVDYDGNTREEDFYFNLTKAELTEMDLSEEGGLEKRIQKIVDAKSFPEIIKLFKSLIIASYGEKSLDGKRFIKNQELTDAFVQTEAYSQLFMELATDADKAAEFVNSIVPADVAAEASKQNDAVAKAKAAANIESLNK